MCSILSVCGVNYVVYCLCPCSMQAYVFLDLSDLFSSRAVLLVLYPLCMLEERFSYRCTFFPGLQARFCDFVADMLGLFVVMFSSENIFYPNWILSDRFTS